MILYNMISYYIISYDIILYHVILYDIILYYIMPTTSEWPPTDTPPSGMFSAVCRKRLKVKASSRSCELQYPHPTTEGGVLSVMELTVEAEGWINIFISQPLSQTSYLIYKERKNMKN